jgi:septal ring factor EnvC (AmiA/AmiB activator)
LAWLIAVVLSPPARPLDVEEIRAKLAAGQMKEQQILEALEALDDRIEELQDEGERLARESARQADDLLRLENHISELESRYERQRAQLKRSLRAFYMHGRRSFLEVVLGTGTADEMANRSRSFQHLVRTQRSRAEAMRITLEELDRQRVELAELLALTSHTRAATERQTSEVQVARTTQLDVFRQLRTDTGRMRVLLARGERAQAQLQRYLASQGIGDDVSLTMVRGSFEAQRGRLHWPVNGRVQRGFGMFHVEGQERPERNRGLDMIVEGTSEVRAMADGEVASVKYVSGMGWTLILRHADGYFTIYSNARTFIVDAGQAVARGEVMGYVGGDGSLEQQKFHTELRKGRRAIDPMPWFGPRN